MSNSYFNTDGAPVNGSTGSSAIMRAEFTAIAAGFALLPTLSGNGNKAVVINSVGTAQTLTTGTLALAGNLSTAGDFTTTGAFNTTLIQGASVSLTLPLVSGTLATLAGTEALTNKTINGMTITASTGTFTLTNGKALSVANSLTLQGTDGTTMTFPATTATLARTDAANTFTGTQTIGALVATTVNGVGFTGTGGKTLTVSNSLTLAGTDATVMTFPSVSDTVVTLSASQTLSNKTFVSPALGTPVSGVATNLTGTAAGLTAGNTTTNANLTGGVTSVGNATTVVTNANLTGDVTSVGNATTLATVNSNVGSFVGANVTVNAKGLVTAASNGSSVIGMTLISTLTASASATLDWTGLSGYNNYLLVLSGLIFSGNPTLNIQFGEGAGPTWKTSTYATTAMYGIPGNSPAADAATVVNAGISIGVNITLSTNPFYSRVSLYNLLAGSVSGAVAQSYTANGAVELAGGVYLNDSAAKTGIRIIPSSGTISSGTATLYGLSS